MRSLNALRIPLTFSACAFGLAITLGLTSGANAKTIPLSYSYTSFSSPTDADHPSYFVKSLTFTLPANFTNAALTITSLKFDDRGVVQLNGATVTSSGYQPVPNGGLNGQMVLSPGGDPVPYTFAHEFNDTVFAPITTNFLPGLNTLDFIVNDTSGGLNFRNGQLSGGYYWYVNQCFDSTGCPFTESGNGKTYYRGKTNPPTGVQFAGKLKYKKKKGQKPPAPSPAPVAAALALTKSAGLSVTPLLSETAQPLLSKTALSSVRLNALPLVPTPIPGAAVLFGTALAGFGFLTTNRKRAVGRPTTSA